MRRTIIFVLISFLFFCCDFNPQNINSNRIIGKKSSRIPYGSSGLYNTKYMNGKKYTVLGFFYRNRVIVYVLDESIIVDYFFSNFVEYDEVKEIPLGISYEELIDILGEPVGLIYGSNYIERIEKGNSQDTFSALYFQRKRRPYSIFNGISNKVVLFSFSFNGKLTLIKEVRQTE